jgi:hypothetical protein
MSGMAPGDEATEWHHHTNSVQRRLASPRAIALPLHGRAPRHPFGDISIMRALAADGP